MPAIGCWVDKLEDSFAAGGKLVDGVGCCVGSSHLLRSFRIRCRRCLRGPAGTDGASAAAAEAEGGDAPSAPLSGPADADDDCPLLTSGPSAFREAESLWLTGTLQFLKAASAAPSARRRRRSAPVAAPAPGSSTKNKVADERPREEAAAPRFCTSQ